MKPRRNSSNNLCIIAAIIITSICMLIFAVDLIYEHNNTHTSYHPHPKKGKQIHYDGIELNIIEDWSKKGELASKLNLDKHLKPISGQTQNTPTSSPPTTPKNPTATSDKIASVTNSIANTGQNIARGKAGISTEQAVNAKKYLDLKDMPADSELALQEKAYYEEKYQISKYEELPFCVVVPSYKNVANDRYVHNMDSIIQQDYQNYRIIFIDDASEDDTGTFIKEYIKEHNLSPSKIQVAINKERTMAMPNLHMAAHNYCKPYEIYMIVDGDDEIVGKQVFKHFNQIFQTQDVWVAYTNFISVRGSIGYSRPFSETTK